jgi:site-specific DNA-methyltransferase (adenine-specific)
VLAKPEFRLLSRSASAASDVWHIHPERNNNGHPCPFPVSVPARAIETSKCNGVILDPFVGSGSTLVAAKAAGKRAAGIDIDERYCEMAANRLAQESLFT